jgi:hypothetical protein
MPIKFECVRPTPPPSGVNLTKKGVNLKFSFKNIHVYQKLTQQKIKKPPNQKSSVKIT